MKKYNIKKIRTISALEDLVKYISKNGEQESIKPEGNLTINR